MLYFERLPKITDPRGNLTFIQHGHGLPFVPKRVFWTYDIPSGARRGGHAYFSQTELIVAINGSFDVCIKHPNEDLEVYTLRRGDEGILLKPLTWRFMENFSTNAMSLHLSDALFEESDYIRDFGHFQRLRRT